MQDAGWGNVAEDAVLLGLSENSPGPSGPSGSSGGDLASRPGMPRGRPVGMIGSKWLRGIWSTNYREPYFQLFQDTPQVVRFIWAKLNIQN